MPPTPYRILFLVAAPALFPGIARPARGAEPEPVAGAKPAADARAPSVETDFAFIIADLRAIPSDRLLADAEKYPAFRELAREGLAVVSLSSGASGSEETLRTLLGAGETGFFQRAAGRHRPERIWLLSPRANRETVELAAGARLFAPDVRLPAYWSLLRRYGPPPPFGEKELEALRKLRAAHGAELSVFEKGLGLLPSPGVAADGDGMVLERMARLIRARKASFAIAVLGGASSLQEGGDPEPKVLGEISAAVNRLQTLLREEPYRNRTLFAYLSLGGRRDKEVLPERPAAGAAVLLAPTLRKGAVIQEPLDLMTLRELILWGADLQANDPPPAVAPEVLKR